MSSKKKFIVTRDLEKESITFNGTIDVFTACALIEELISNLDDRAIEVLAMYLRSELSQSKINALFNKEKEKNNE